MEHRSANELAAALEAIGGARELGTLELIVRRPREDEREVLDEASLDLELGLVGDRGSTRGSGRTPDGSAKPLAR